MAKLRGVREMQLERRQDQPLALMSSFQETPERSMQKGGSNLIGNSYVFRWWLWLLSGFQRVPVQRHEQLSNQGVHASWGQILRWRGSAVGSSKSMRRNPILPLLCSPHSSVPTPPAFMGSPSPGELAIEKGGGVMTSLVTQF